MNTLLYNIIQHTLYNIHDMVCRSHLRRHAVAGTSTALVPVSEADLAQTYDEVAYPGGVGIEDMD
jgi:hypothetical protein